MSNWKAVYRHKRRAKEDEAFACTGCSAQYEPEDRSEGCHSGGPPNSLCTCPKCTMKILSDAYRENFGKIRWDNAS